LRHNVKNPKKFWKYINSKRKVKTHIADLKTVDNLGVEVTAESQARSQTSEWGEGGA